MKKTSLLLASTLALLLACSDSAEEDVELDVQKRAGSVSAKTVAAAVQADVKELTLQELQPQIKASGVVEAVEEITINVDFTGTVKRVLVDEGTAVKAGQLIAELDPQKRRLALQRAEQMLLQSQAAAKEAKLNLERRESLAELKTVSKEVLDKSKLALERAQAQYKEAEAAKALAKRELDDSRITAPVSGVIDTRSVEVGETVLAGRPLFTLQAVGALRVQVWVSEANINRIAIGDVANLTIRGQTNALNATVDSIGINAHKNTGNYSVRLLLNDAGKIRPGMTVSADIKTAIEEQLVLPESALTERDRQKVVFTIVDGKAVIRKPVVRAGFDGHWIVVSGLSEGDQLAVSNLDSLFEGASVTSNAP